MTRCSKIGDNLTRKKPTEDWLFDSALKRCLTTLDLTFIGVGTVVGAGLYVVIGQLARDIAGPAVVLSFLIAAIAAFFSGLCYAEFGCRIPKAGSAYVYSYVAVGEFWAFVVGWNIILEYIIAGACVARAASEYINSVVGGYIYQFFMNDIVSWNEPALGPFPDFVAMALAIIVTIIVSAGTRKTAICNKIVTSINFLVITFIIVAGLWFLDVSNWNQSFCPYGVGGVMSAASSCFYAFVGFDVIGTAGEEAINPKRSIPLSIILCLAISFLAYFGVATILTLIMPYNQLSRFAPLAEAFSQRGFTAAKYVVAIGGLCATMSTLLSNTFAAARVMYSMSSDGLLFHWFAHVHDKTSVPVRATLVSGSVIALLALLLDIKQLVEMLSIGTLVAFTMVAISLLVTRYTPGVQSITLENEGSKEQTNRWLQSVCCRPEVEDTVTSDVTYQRLDNTETGPTKATIQPDDQTSYKARLGTFLLTVSITGLCICISKTNSLLAKVEAWAIFLFCLFGLLIVACLMYITRLPRNQATFPFMVPGVPYIPALTVFVNVILVVNLNYWTYIRFGIWMVLGFFVYFFYGYSHSVEAVKPNEDGRKEEFIITETPDFGKEVHEAQPSSPVQDPH